MRIQSSISHGAQSMPSERLRDAISFADFKILLIFIIQIEHLKAWLPEMLNKSMVSTDLGESSLAYARSWQSGPLDSGNTGDIAPCRYLAGDWNSEPYSFGVFRFSLQQLEIKPAYKQNKFFFHVAQK